MIKLNNLDLWSLSGNIHKESLFQAQIKSVGTQKTRFMERYQKNFAGSKRSALYNSIIASFILLIYGILPIGPLLALNRLTITSDNIANQLFSISVVFGVVYLFNFVYYFLIGFLAMMEFLQGKTFKYLRTLPLSTEDIQKITLFTIIRMNGLQLLVIIFTTPVLIYALLRNVLLSGIAIVLNIVNAMFMFYLFIVLSNFLSRKVFNTEKSSKLYTIIRIIVNLFYVLAMFTISYAFSFLPLLTQGNIFSAYFTTSQQATVNIILSMVFFPISSGYIISLALLPFNLIPTEIIYTSILGFAIFLLITLILMRKGNGILRSLTYEESGSGYKENKSIIDPEKIKIKVSSPKVAYIKRVFIMATREQSKFALFLLPVFIPIVTAFSFTTTSSSGTPLIADPFYGMFFFFSFIPIFLINALIEAEEGLGGLISTLPIKNRDIFRSKQIIMTILLLISVILYAIIIGPAKSLTWLNSLIKLISLSITIPILSLIVYSMMFGKINKKYTLYKVNTSNTFAKYIVIGFFQIVLLVIIAGAFNLIYTMYSITAVSFTVFLVIGNIILLLILDLITRIIIKG